MVELVLAMEPNKFEEKIIIQVKKYAIKEAKKPRPGLVIWTDGFKLDQRATTAIYWRRISLGL